MKMVNFHIKSKLSSVTNWSRHLVEPWFQSDSLSNLSVCVSVLYWQQKAK